MRKANSSGVRISQHPGGRCALSLGQRGESQAVSIEETSDDHEDDMIADLSVHEGTVDCM